MIEKDFEIDLMIDRSVDENIENLYKSVKYLYNKMFEFEKLQKRVEKIENDKKEILTYEDIEKFLNNWGSTTKAPEEIIHGSDNVKFYLLENGQMVMVFNSNNTMITFLDNFYYITPSHSAKEWFTPRLKKHTGDFEIGKFYFCSNDLEDKSRHEYYMLILNDFDGVYVDGICIDNHKVNQLYNYKHVYEVIK